jgi:hypothetical protein
MAVWRGWHERQDERQDAGGFSGWAWGVGHGALGMGRWAWGCAGATSRRQFHGAGSGGRGESGSCGAGRRSGACGCGSGVVSLNIRRWRNVTRKRPTRLSAFAGKREATLARQADAKRRRACGRLKIANKRVAKALEVTRELRELQQDRARRREERAFREQQKRANSGEKGASAPGTAKEREQENKQESRRIRRSRSRAPRPRTPKRG